MSVESEFKKVREIKKNFNFRMWLIEGRHTFNWHPKADWFLLVGASLEAIVPSSNPILVRDWTVDLLHIRDGWEAGLGSVDSHVDNDFVCFSL